MTELLKIMVYTFLFHGLPTCMVLGLVFHFRLYFLLPLVGIGAYLGLEYLFKHIGEWMDLE